MAGTQVRMYRTPLVVEGTNKYEITATCTVKGDLADKYIFLLNIITADDPKDDTLARVIQVADVTPYKTNRDAAVTAGDSSWRSATVTLQFDDIEVANAAWKELSSRINTLVGQVDTYNEEFITLSVDGDVIMYPTFDEGILLQLKTDYADAAAAVSTAEEDRDTHAEECADLQSSIEIVDERLLEAQGDFTRMTQIQAALSTNSTSLLTVYAQLFTNNAGVRTLNNASTATTIEKADIETLLSTASSLLVQFNAANASLSTLLTGLVATEVSTIQLRISTLTSERNALLTDLNRCNMDLAILQGAVDAARATRDAALAAVRAVCADFVP